MTIPLQKPEHAPAAAAGPASPAIDLVHLSAQSLGDRNLELELLQLFDRQSEQILLRLEAGLALGERRWVRDLCHTLKGSARAVGAFHVADAADQYGEALLSSASDAELTALRLALAARVREARAKIAELLKDA
jgi:HPt (histidine-containing phosphotransfer) domain-containing protein